MIWTSVKPGQHALYRKLCGSRRRTRLLSRPSASGLEACRWFGPLLPRPTCLAAAARFLLCALPPALLLTPLADCPPVSAAAAPEAVLASAVGDSRGMPSLLPAVSPGLVLPMSVAAAAAAVCFSTACTTDCPLQCRMNDVSSKAGNARLALSNFPLTLRGMIFADHTVTTRTSTNRKLVVSKVSCVAVTNPMSTAQNTGDQAFRLYRQGTH